MQIFRFSTARVKIHQIIHVIFQTKSEFGSLFSVMRCHFIETSYAIEKRITSKCKFSDLSLLVFKFTKFAMSFLQPRASFYSNFTSLINDMIDHSSVLFHLKLYVLSTKGTHQSADFKTFSCSHEN